MAKKILYKNHCTPQEQISSGGRYYLDSDCGRKLTGSASLVPTSTSYALGTVTSGASMIANAQDFVFIKNLGGGDGDDVIISLNGGVPSPEFTIRLSSGEAISLELRDADNVADTKVFIKCENSGETTTIEYFTGT